MRPSLWRVLQPFGCRSDGGQSRCDSTGIDQVVIGDMQRTRLKDIKALLFLGANDSFLPGNLMQAGLLSEGDRTKFAREKIALTPGAKEQAYVQKYYLVPESDETDRETLRILQ